jgi:hypothetical protein
MHRHAAVTKAICLLNLLLEGLPAFAHPVRVRISCNIVPLVRNSGALSLQVTILTGSIVRVWGVLEQVLKRHEHSLNKADRSMRIIRVDMDSEGALIGVRYKEALLPEVSHSHQERILVHCSIVSIPNSQAAFTVHFTSKHFHLHTALDTVIC